MAGEERLANRVKAMAARIWPGARGGQYDPVSHEDEKRFLDRNDEGSATSVDLDDNESGTVGTDHQLRQTLRWFQLTSFLLGSLLAFVCLAWIGRELGSRRVFVDRLYDPMGTTFETLSRNTAEVWSPAMEAVRLKPVVFHNNFHEDRTPWQGPPTDEVDKAWDKLYKGIGVIKIPKEDAMRLPNQTLAIPGEDDGYIVGIEVYHQLHCIDIIRRAMYPARYGGDKGMNEKKKAEYWVHVDHCIDNIRQTIMCYSDISTIPWRWHERVQGEFPDAHTTHVCRDFDALTEWMLHPDRHFPQEKYQLRVEALHAGSHGHHG